VATHERELREPADLCTPDGRRLNPAAAGWSRRPLHRANLRGVWGRTKRWDYWALLAGDLVVGLTYADVDYLGIAGLSWASLESGRAGGREVAVPGARGLDLPEQPGSRPLRYRGRGLELELIDDPTGTTLRARWTERDGTPGELHARVALPSGHESLNVVIPWSERRFQFTSKQQARPTTGSFRLAGVTRVLESAPSGAWGVLDVGRGRWPYRTRWNWGAGAGRALGGGPIVGVQVGGKWTEGSGATENGILVDGRLTKIGEELVWEYDWDHPLRPWRVRAPSGVLDLTLAPRYDRHAKTQALLLATEVHQVFGTWSGSVVPDGGEALRVEGLQGFAEESRSRW
jgi:hypothetical protein